MTHTCTHVHTQADKHAHTYTQTHTHHPSPALPAPPHRSPSLHSPPPNCSASSRHHPFHTKTSDFLTLAISAPSTNPFPDPPPSPRFATPPPKNHLLRLRPILPILTLVSHSPPHFLPYPSPHFPSPPPFLGILNILHAPGPSVPQTPRCQGGGHGNCPIIWPRLMRVAQTVLPRRPRTQTPRNMVSTRPDPSPTGDTRQATLFHRWRRTRARTPGSGPRYQRKDTHTHPLTDPHTYIHTHKLYHHCVSGPLDSRPSPGCADVDPADQAPS